VLDCDIAECGYDVGKLEGLAKVLDCDIAEYGYDPEKLEGAAKVLDCDIAEYGYDLEKLEGIERELLDIPVLSLFNTSAEIVLAAGLAINFFTASSITPPPSTTSSIKTISFG